MGVVDFVELDDEVRVEVEEDSDSIDESLKNFEGSLGFNDGGFAEGLFEVIDDLNVPLFGLLEVLSLSLSHRTKCNLYKFYNIFPFFIHVQIPKIIIQINKAYLDLLIRLTDLRRIKLNPI